MKKKSSAFFWIILFLLVIGAAYLYLNRQKVITLILPDNNQSTTTAGQLLGGDRDAHGCIGSAGYSWCEAKQKCLRPWEEVCAAAATSSNIIKYYCQEGMLRATYETSSVKLILKDGSTTTLPQVISASGTRYEKGKMVFISKGDNAFIMEKNIITYTNCVAGNQTTKQDISTFTDQEKTFSFSHPSRFVLSGGELGYTPNWSYNASSSGLILAVVDIPRSFLPGTNFGEAKFSVGTSADPDAVKNCLKASYGDFGTTTILTIGDRQFTKITYTDVGAGNYYDIASYRTVYNGQCYVAETLIHSSNIENYSPDQGIKPFDRLKVSLILDGMVRSFKLLPAASANAQ
jgi:membrane-bound inhibitor of C-type lysozyme